MGSGSSRANRRESVSGHLTALLCAITFVAFNAADAGAMPTAGTRTALSLLAGDATKKLAPKTAALLDHFP
jgi:hypothetical protein